MLTLLFYFPYNLLLLIDTNFINVDKYNTQMKLKQMNKICTVNMLREEKYYRVCLSVYSRTEKH